MIAGVRLLDTMTAKVSTASAATPITSGVDVFEWPRPSRDSTGDAVSPSPGISSQPTR
jgi:hypothetical protein